MEVHVSMLWPLEISLVQCHQNSNNMCVHSSSENMNSSKKNAWAHGLWGGESRLQLVIVSLNALTATHPEGKNIHSVYVWAFSLTLNTDSEAVSDGIGIWKRTGIGLKGNRPNSLYRSSFKFWTSFVAPNDQHDSLREKSSNKYVVFGISGGWLYEE